MQYNPPLSLCVCFSCVIQPRMEQSRSPFVDDFYSNIDETHTRTKIRGIDDDGNRFIEITQKYRYTLRTWCVCVCVCVSGPFLGCAPRFVLSLSLSLLFFCFGSSNPEQYYDDRVYISNGWRLTFTSTNQLFVYMAEFSRRPGHDLRDAVCLPDGRVYVSFDTPEEAHGAIEKSNIDMVDHGFVVQKARVPSDGRRVNNRPETPFVPPRDFKRVLASIRQEIDEVANQWGDWDDDGGSYACSDSGSTWSRAPSYARHRNPSSKEADDWVEGGW